MRQLPRRRNPTRIYAVIVFLVFFLSRRHVVSAAKGENGEDDPKKARRDARIVRQILKASERGEHYRVLGIRPVGPLDWVWNKNPLIPFIQNKVSSWEFTLPGNLHISFGFLKPKKGRKSDNNNNNNNVDRIKRAYRTRAIQVHPDKNGDANAREAFLAVEASASLLLDPNERHVYDAFLAQQRAEQWDQVRGIVHSVWSFGQTTVFGVVQRWIAPIVSSPGLLILAYLIV